MHLESVTLDSAALEKLNNRRSEMAILALILRLTKGGAKKTKILYDANLSGRQLKNYLSFLIEAGCLKEKKSKGKGNLYYTTSKGKLFLSYWTKILALFETEMIIDPLDE